MTATHISDTTALPWRLGDGVHIRQKGHTKPRLIIAIHRVHDGIEYVIGVTYLPTGPTEGRREVLRIWTSSGTSSFLSALAPDARSGAR